MRPLQELVIAPGSAGVVELLAALPAALAGRGPALGLVPGEPGAYAERVRAAVLGEWPAGSGPAGVADRVAVVVSTSGSTGAPQGVLLSGEALRAGAAATHERLGGEGLWVLTLPVQHVAGLAVLVRALVAGTVPLVPQGWGAPGLGVDPLAAAWLAARREADASGGPGRAYTAIVPTQLVRVLGSRSATAALAELDAVLVGAAACPQEVLAQARAAGIRVVTTYGGTETCGGCIYDGLPLSGVELAIGASGNTAASNEGAATGAITVHGPVLAEGYRGNPELTAQRFVSGWYLTGDLGRIGSDGRLEVLGRADDVVQVGGVNVALPAVAERLRAHPAIRDVVVIAVPDEQWGSSVAAFLEAGDPANPPSLSSLRSWVSEELGTPARPTVAVVLGSIPLLSSGKPDRAALRALALAELDAARRTSATRRQQGMI